MDDLKRVRAVCEKHLRELTIPDPFEIKAFCDSVSELRGKPMILMATQMTPTADSCSYGLWVGLDVADLVFYEQDTSPLHRTAIVLHEIAHMLLGHPSDIVDQPGLAEMLPDIDPAKVRHWLSRRIYSSENELQAELLSSLILERTSLRKSRPDGWVTRLGEALQHPRRSHRI